MSVLGIVALAAASLALGMCIWVLIENRRRHRRLARWLALSDQEREDEILRRFQASK